VKCILGRITSSLCNTGCKFTRVSEKWSAISQALNGASQTRRMVDKGLLIAACNHTVTVTLVLQTRPIIINKPDEQSRKNKFCIVATTSLLVVSTNSLIYKWIMGGGEVPIKG
jgi:hypothetical protein